MFTLRLYYYIAMKIILSRSLSLSVSLMLFAALNCQAQLPKYLEGKVIYPVFDQHPWMGVIKTDTDGMDYDKKLDYKVVIDVYDEVTDSASLHGSFREAARTYNLNIANGVPQEKLKMAIVVHGGAVDAILTNEIYNNRFGVDNPNLELLTAMKEHGVEIYVCGQNLGFLRIEKSSVADPVKVALSAKTTFIALDQQGYTYLNVNED
jgi:intracellular sulfur oxidation DsrE/DsrF family protein